MINIGNGDQRSVSNPTLNSPPLALTLAQVKFNAVPTMEKYYKDIQDEFRKELEFIFHETEDSSVIIQGPQRTEVQKSALWGSISADRKKRLILANDALTIETTEYPGFTDFIPNFERALEIVKKFTQTSYVSRVGYRYINRIESSEEKPLEYFLKPQLLGFRFSEIEVTKAVSRTEAIAHTEEGVLRVHCMQLISEKDQPKTLLLPPDINTRLEVRPLSISENEIYAFLDIDHFREFSREPIRFDIPEVMDRLDKLHQGGYHTFISGVDKNALEEWS